MLPTQTARHKGEDLRARARMGVSQAKFIECAQAIGGATEALRGKPDLLQREQNSMNWLTTSTAFPCWSTTRSLAKERRMCRSGSWFMKVRNVSKPTRSGTKCQSNAEPNKAWSWDRQRSAMLLGELQQKQKGLSCCARIFVHTTRQAVLQT